MQAWLKTLIGAMCLITILIHLVPQGKFVKYVRFYGGMVFILLAAGPVLKIFSSEGELERLLELEFLKEEHYNLETAVEGMADLKNDAILEAYHQELLRQISDIVSAYGLTASDLRLTYADDGYTLEGVEVQIVSDGEQADVTERIRTEISGIYMIESSKIRITNREG